MSRLQIPDVPEQSNRRWKKGASYGNRIRREAYRHYRNRTEPTRKSVKWVLGFIYAEEMLDWDRKTLANAI